MFYSPITNTSQKLRSVKPLTSRLLFLSIFAFFVFSSCQKESLSEGLLLENDVEQAGILAKKGQNDEKRAQVGGCQCTYRVIIPNGINGGSYNIQVNEAGIQPGNAPFSFFVGGNSSWYSSNLPNLTMGYPTTVTEDFLPRPYQSIFALQSHILDVQYNATGAWTADLEINCTGTTISGNTASNTFYKTITRPSNLGSPGAWWKERIDCIGCRAVANGECSGLTPG